MKQLIAGGGVALGRHDARSAALQPFLSVVKKKITGTLPRTHAAVLAPKEGDPL